MGKGGIAHDEQFLFFSIVFSTSFDKFPPFSSVLVCKLFHFGRGLKFVVWEGVNTKDFPFEGIGEDNFIIE